MQIQSIVPNFLLCVILCFLLLCSPQSIQSEMSSLNARQESSLEEQREAYRALQRATSEAAQEALRREAQALERGKERQAEIEARAARDLEEATALVAALKVRFG